MTVSAAGRNGRYLTSRLARTLAFCAACALVLHLGAGVCEAQERPASEPARRLIAHGGAWTVRDDAVWVDGGPGPKLVALGTDFADGEVGVEVHFDDARDGNAGLVVHVREAGVGADAFIGYEIALDPGRGVLRVGRHRHNFTLIRDVKVPVPLRRWIPLVVRIKGRRLEVDVDGRAAFSWQDEQDPLGAGAVGLRPWQRPAGFRNLWIARAGRRETVRFQPGAIGSGEPPAPAGPPLDGLPPIALVTRHPLSAPNTISCDIWQSRPARPGCSIRVCQPGEPFASARTVFTDPDGCIYDMSVSYDARALLFSYRGKGEAYWHIWRIGVDGGGLRQLTRGPCHDISPAALPDGDIVFVSTRRGGYTLCQPGPASNLHRMAADPGAPGGIRCVSMNTLADFSPFVLPDGRVLFTRWEYVDRDLTYRQSLWSQNPDGTGYRLVFGNTVRDVGTFWQAKPLPGEPDAFVATFAPHHGWPHGAIGLIRTKYGPEAPRGEGFQYVTKEFPRIEDGRFPWAYRDPYPVTDGEFLVSCGVGAQRYRIFLLGLDGGKTLVYEDPAISCFHPIPLVPRPAPPRLARLPDERVEYGTFLLADVYEGLTGIRRGRAAKIRIMEQVRKTEDLVNRAYDQSPVMSYGTYYAKRTWGEVDLAPDGSAHFQAPALREIYFQVLDDQGRELQRMTSATQIMPGEYLSCIGCHEPRSRAPARGRVPLAARRPPARPVVPAWAEDGLIDFCNVVQPVLDKHCVRCHSGADPKGGVTFTGDKTRLFSMAYDNLLGRSRSYRQHDMFTGAILPSEAAKGKPLVHFFWLLRTPSGVNQPLWTGSHASRLSGKIEGDHSGKPLPGEDRRRIYCWIDADVPYYATYAHSRPNSPGRRDLCCDGDSGREADWYARDFLGVYNRRCASCHGPMPHPNDHARIWTGQLAWIDFSNPALSPALTAHLSKKLGGRGIDKATDGRKPPVFESTEDPDYHAMLRAIEQGKAGMLARPRADMPGFRGGHPRE